VLQRLVVENLAVVERAEINFGPALNVLTGETGAGKSILIDALKLLIEKKYPLQVIREEKAKTTVEALFADNDQEIVLRRELAAGRSTAFINGRLATFNQLGETAAKLLAIHGQRDHDFLLNEANHRDYVDRFAASTEILEALAVAAKRFRRARREFDGLRERQARRNERLELLDFQLREIEDLGLAEGQEEELQNSLAIMTSSEEILKRSEECINLLYGGDESVHVLLARCLEHGQALARLFPELSGLNEEISRFRSLIPDFSAQFLQLQEHREFDQAHYDELAARQQRLNRLKSRHQADFSGLLRLVETWRQEKSELSDLELQLDDLQKEMNASLQEYIDLNERLRDKRRQAALKLQKAVVSELGKLEMKQPVFEVRFEENQPGPDTLMEQGSDRVRFFFSANPGQPAGPLNQVASGGELSRLMLVLQALGRDENGLTFIFDEIDAGIGGRTAEFVGQKLRQIASRNQVICISHLPQIASFADHHFQVNKEVRCDRTFSEVRFLDQAERCREIARLMAGSAGHQDVLKAAARLLEKNSG